ncbi:hypothetical protein PROFUN_16314, partial [Planoprotostelium fungivorum]
GKVMAQRRICGYLSNSPDLVADFKARTARVTTSKRKRKN